MALHVFAATSGNFWEAPRAAIAVKKNVPLEWMELSQLSLYMALPLPFHRTLQTKLACSILMRDLATRWELQRIADRAGLVRFLPFNNLHR